MPEAESLDWYLDMKRVRYKVFELENYRKIDIRFGWRVRRASDTRRLSPTRAAIGSDTQPAYGREEIIIDNVEGGGRSGRVLRYVYVE